MKKIFFALAIVLHFMPAAAQHVNTGKFDAHEYGKELVATNLSLVADKNLCGLGEITNVHVRITVVPGESAPESYNYEFMDPADAPWKVSGFTIISGGATVAYTDGSTAQLKMPATMPADKAVLVQVVLKPVTKPYQEIILLTTIYLDDNDNAFYVNCPYLNINNEKWTIDISDGINMSVPDVPANYQNATAAVDAKQKAALERLRVEQAKKNAGKMNVSLDAATSNCKAIYSAEEKTTAIILTGGKLKAVNGRLKDESNNFMITISVPGRGMDRYTIKTKKNITVAFSLPLQGVACGCADDREWQLEREKNGEKGPTCNGGFIEIDQLILGKDGYIKGHFRANLESATTDGKVYYADVEGKFKARLVN